MELAMIRDHLALARQHVALGERHISRQREIVAQLNGSGRDNCDARTLLRLFEDCQKLHVAGRDRLELMLAEELRRQAG